MANESGLSPYMDSGTGLYDGPPAEVTYGSEHDPEPTGAHPGPPVSVTVESPPDHLAGSTGAYPGPPAEVTTVQHPGRLRSKAVARADVEDKAVSKGDPGVVSVSQPTPARWRAPAAGRVVGGGDTRASSTGGAAAPAGEGEEAPAAQEDPREGAPLGQAPGEAPGGGQAPSHQEAPVKEAK